MGKQTPMAAAPCSVFRIMYSSSAVRGERLQPQLHERAVDRMDHMSVACVPCPSSASARAHWALGCSGISRGVQLYEPTRAIGEWT